ncbi:MAG: hypothetical protein AAF702_06925 [Chloroflexota bacterium]
MWAIKFTLWLSAFFNLGAALLLLFPGSYLGQSMGLPDTVHPLYAGMTAYMIALFGGAYAWLGMQAEPVRSMVYFGAIGKLGVFVLAVGLWMSSTISALLLGLASGDLIFSLFWFWWLRSAK